MELKYGDSFLSIELPDFIEWRVLQQEAPFFLPHEKSARQKPDQHQIINKGIHELVEQLRPVLAPTSSVLLVVPDHTRKCHLPFILPALTAHLEKEFRASIKILIANGSHVLQPEETISHLVSPEIYERYPTIQHDAIDDNAMVFLGRTTNGTDIRLNKLVTEADAVITVGGMLYHYFAGFGGGPKMLFPGIAAYESIRQNHSRTISSTGQFHPQARNGNIENNPVYGDLRQVLDFLPHVLSLQVVLSPLGEIVYCEAGPVLETQKKLIPKVEQLYSVKLQDKADVVIASAGGFPSDVNLIQSHKSIHHAFQAVKENGRLIILAECREGIGSKTFLPYFDCGSSEEIGRALLGDFKINGQTALALKEKTEKSRLYLISALQPELVSRIGMIPCRHISEVPLHSAQIKKGIIMPQANITVPL